MDHRLDDTDFDRWVTLAAIVTAILESDSYRQVIDAAIDAFADVNNLLEQYGFEPVDSLKELKGWANVL